MTALLPDVVGSRSRDLVAHLTPESMERAHRFLVCKALAEFAHERLVSPEPDGRHFAVRSADERVIYRFHAHRHDLDHWVINPWSITREIDGIPAALDALDLIVDLAPELGIPEALLPTYFEEISSTLASAAWKDVHETHTAADLVHADFQTIEAAMTEGHPAFVANNGRIGFGADDFAAYAPEAGNPFAIVWLAVRRSHATLSCGDGVDEESLYAGELDSSLRAGFDAQLRGLSVDPADYLFMPAHPWQWLNKLAITFAPDVARRDIVCLGTSADLYRAQQSIRTFFNAVRPDRYYVKTALSIQNMGFMRGLSPRYMAATPAINDWVAGLVESDPELQSRGFGVLRELAAIGYTGGAYQRLAADSPYKKMFAALWRDSPVPRLAPGERLATMASLLHRDREGKHLVTALISVSGLEPAEWVRRYLDAYLRPLVHCLWRYELAFMPHGENLILVMEGDVPVRVFMKDIGEEIAVMGNLPLPDDVERVRAAVPDDVKPLAILTDVFDGFFRFLAAIFAEDQVLPGEEFWALVAGCLADYQRDHPELGDAFARCDLFADEFAHSCLNRLQLRNTLSMVDLSDQAESLIFAGTLTNPIARYRRS